VAGLERDAVAHHLFLVAAAMVAGFIFMGWIAERLSRFGVGPMSVAATGMILFMTTQAAIVANSAVPVLVLWVLFGFFGTTGIVPYAALSQQFPPHLAGRLNTGLNVLVFVVAFSGQWGIGAVIDLWPATASGGYAVEGYRAAFGVMLGLQVLALIWFSLFRREGVPRD
jgi:MFS family permease